MRLWERISRASSHLSSQRSWMRLSLMQLSLTQLSWRKLGRRGRKATKDPETALIRDLSTRGTPMSLASVKAALDATASVQEAKDTDTIIKRIESVPIPRAGTTCISLV